MSYNNRARSLWNSKASEPSSSKPSPRSTAHTCSSIALRPQRINTEDCELNDGPGRAKNGDLDFIGVYSFYGVHKSNVAPP
jgi:hypothetical protein